MDNDGGDKEYGDELFIYAMALMEEREQKERDQKEREQREEAENEAVKGKVTETEREGEGA